MTFFWWVIVVVRKIMATHKQVDVIHSGISYFKNSELSENWDDNKMK